MVITRNGEALFERFPAGPYTGLYGQVYHRPPKPDYYHLGLDIGNAYRPYAPGISGTVVAFYNDGSFGRGICLDTGIGKFRYRLFAHNEQVIVAEGQFVEADQLMAVSGATGDVDGAHIHIQCSPDTRFVHSFEASANPLDFLATPKELAQPMTPSERGILNIAWGDFDRAIASYRALRDPKVTPQHIIALLPNEGIETALANGRPEDDLNAAMQMRGRLTTLATSDVADEVYALLGGAR